MLVPWLLVLLVLGITFAVLSTQFEPDDRIPGIVASQNCRLQCTDQGCAYLGTVQLLFALNDTDWLVTTYPQSTCGADCCATMVAEQTPVWITLVNDNPYNVSYFSDRPPASGTMFRSASITLFVELVLVALALVWVRK